MNENIDLTEILEGCPVGTMFYSSIPDIKRDFNLWKCGFEAGEKLMIEKALEWFKHQKEEIGISWFDDYEIRFRKAMEE